jgi:excinuclease ABC subunit C
MDEMSWELKKAQDRSTALERFVKKLNIPSLSLHSNFKIECYDISNIQGKNATGSMVVFIDGKASKSSYRKFKIRLKDEPDDFGMLQEVLTRRFSRSTKKQKDQSFTKYPDLMIIDGGKGQLSSVLEILEKLDIKVPTVGLAKKEEEIFKYINDEFKKIRLLKGTAEYFLIQRIRDEAHRFAIKYHRTLRSSQQIKSVLDDIPGVGNLVKRRLLRAFGSFDGIKKASISELQSVVKNRRTVENIKKVI